MMLRNIFGYVTDLYRPLFESKSLHPLILKVFDVINISKIEILVSRNVLQCLA